MADTDFNPQSRFFQTRRVVAPEGEWYTEWRPPRYGVVPERLYVVTDADIDRPEMIAYKTLGDVRYWWEILHYNQVQDPFSLETGDKLRIPLYDIPVVTSFAEVLKPDVVRSVIRRKCVSYPPFQDPDDIVEVASIPQPQPVVVLNFGFPVPACLSGTGHFQVQASLTPDFLNPVLSKLTQADITRWYYYDPSSNSGAGGFVSFPTSGIDISLLSGHTVYHSIVEGELDPDNTYFVRYRVWYATQPGLWQETEWYAPPAIQLV